MAISKVSCLLALNPYTNNSNALLVPSHHNGNYGPMAFEAANFFNYIICEASKDQMEGILDKINVVQIIL